MLIRYQGGGLSLHCLSTILAKSGFHKEVQGWALLGKGFMGARLKFSQAKNVHQFQGYSCNIAHNKSIRQQPNSRLVEDSTVLKTVFLHNGIQSSCHRNKPALHTDMERFPRSNH